MSALAPTDAPSLHPLLAQLADRHGFVPLSPDAVDAYTQQPGLTLLAFTEDPVRYRETLDLAVIAPELARTFENTFRCGVLYPEAARKVAPRYGFARWPALVVLRDGEYVGAIDGLRDWEGYLTEMAALLAAAPSRPPSVGIAVKSAAAPSSCGH
jgi:hydrogenase-1 operon protein HyaE